MNERESNSYEILKCVNKAKDVIATRFNEITSPRIKYQENTPTQRPKNTSDNSELKIPSLDHKLINSIMSNIFSRKFY